MLGDSMRTLLQSNSTIDQIFEPEDNKPYAALAVLTMMLLVAVAIALGHMLETWHISWMSEAGGALLVGMLTGLILYYIPFSTKYEDLFYFDSDFFFIALLPPIMFDAGYSMNVNSFFSNIGGILLLAFGGTIVSAIIIALFMWLVGEAGISYRISFLDSCLFGSMVSATDPVTVLAIFGRVNVNKDLHALVFGEAVLNDAVAIVLYTVVSNVGKDGWSAGRVLMGIVSFLKIFFGSLLLGLAVGVLAAFVFRSQFFRSDGAPLEAALLILLAYCSFYIAHGFELSGIVSIMVCSMVMAKYVRPNLLESSDATVQSFFRVFAWLAETFIFVYIGLFIFIRSQPWDMPMFWSFLFFSLVALAISRAANVFPNMAIVNMTRPPEMRFPASHQFMLWWSGLRGAMAFALAILGRLNMLNEGDDTHMDGKVVLTTTFFLVLITVLVNGGATNALLERLDLGDVPKPTLPPPVVDPYDMELATKQANGDAASASAGHHPKTLKEKMHHFHRTGGIQERFKKLDDKIGQVLLGSNAPVPGMGGPTGPSRVNVPTGSLGMENGSNPFDADLEMMRPPVRGAESEALDQQ